MPITQNRAFELQILSALNKADLQVRCTMKENTVIAGLNVTLSIPGQTRDVFISAKKFNAAQIDRVVAEQIEDEVKFAAWLLLEKEEA